MDTQLQINHAIHKICGMQIDRYIDNKDGYKYKKEICRWVERQIKMDRNLNVVGVEFNPTRD